MFHPFVCSSLSYFIPLSVNPGWKRQSPKPWQMSLEPQKMTAVDLLKEPQDAPTTLYHFCFLSSRLWRARGSPAIPHFPFIQNQLSRLIKEKFIQMLLAIAISFLSQSPSREANLTSRLIGFTPGFAIAINSSKLSAHDSGAENTTLWASPGCPHACDRSESSVTLQLSY